MKVILLSIFTVLVFSACSTKQDNFYDRSNNASEKALEGLERDTK